MGVPLFTNVHQTWASWTPLPNTPMVNGKTVSSNKQEHYRKTIKTWLKSSSGSGTCNAVSVPRSSCGDAYCTKR